MEKTARHISFSGRVQGVGFRFTAHRIASEYGITGYVKNLPGGTVEMRAQGTEKQIQSCIDSIKENFGANIQETRLTEVDFDPAYDNFRITR